LGSGRTAKQRASPEENERGEFLPADEDDEGAVGDITWDIWLAGVGRLPEGPETRLQEGLDLRIEVKLRDVIRNFDVGGPARDEPQVF
jgi:hypothetical protein